MKLRATLALLCLIPVVLHAQTPDTQTTTITTRSSLVLIPALVKTKSGDLVYTLTAKDFKLTDDGVEQPLTLEEDNGGQPLALVVAVENGSDGARYLDRYGTLGTMIENIVGDVPHKIAVVSFDGAPNVLEDFTPDIAAVNTALRSIRPGDRNAAILDTLSFSVDMLRRQPQTYRRAILLISETVDHGSQATLDDALRTISDTNTAIYAVAFSSSRSNAKREGPKTFGQGPIPDLSSPEPVPPGPRHGCFSRDKNDPQVDTTEKAIEQDWDCLSLLAPPLRLAKIAFLVAVNGLSKNVPETVAHLTGGEYYAFSNTSNLERDLFTISNHVPNRYVLSFHPQAPHPGLHALQLTLPDHIDLTILARSSYWADDDTIAPAK